MAKMFALWSVLCLLLLSDFGVEATHRLRQHKAIRRLRALPNDGQLRFEPEPYSKKLELNSSGKIHCKVAGGAAPVIQWFQNDADPLPDGVQSVNGTLLVGEASRSHSGRYSCLATDGNHTIRAHVQLDVVVSPRVIEPAAGLEVHVSVGSDVWLNCRSAGDPEPMTHWDRNLTILTTAMEGVEVEGGSNSSNSRILLMKNGTLLIRGAKEQDTDRYGCTAGSAAGLARHELMLTVHPEGELLPSESSGVAGKAVLVSVSVAGAYMVLVLALMLYCRRRRRLRRQRGEKMELEMVEGREKLVEEGEEEKPKLNGAPAHNGRLLAHERDSGADNSEVSAASRASKKSGHYDHLTVPRSLLTDFITLGRGEFGDVMLAKIDVTQLKSSRGHEGADSKPKVKPVLVKALTTKDENQLAEFRRQLDLFSRVRHDNVVRIYGLCNEAEPHYMLLEHTDWGDLKQFLLATRSPDERAEYKERVGVVEPEQSARVAPPLAPAHAALLAVHLARAADTLARRRHTHRDIAARNCVITSKLHLKLSFPALTRGPHAHEYHKLHDQVIPLRWLPAEAVLEGDYSTKSDVYMFAATVWEIYTKAELPFAKLNDNSVMERIKSGALEWTTPDPIPDRLATLLKKCWSPSPTERPLFDAVCEEMNDVVKDITSHNLTEASESKDGD